MSVDLLVDAFLSRIARALLRFIRERIWLVILTFELDNFLEVSEDDLIGISMGVADVSESVSIGLVDIAKIPESCDHGISTGEDFCEETAGVSIGLDDISRRPDSCDHGISGWVTICVSVKDDDELVLVDPASI